MSALHPWARTRKHRASEPGRHRQPRVTQETSMPASAAASQPLAAGQTVATVTITRPVAPDPLVECGFCRVSRPSSQMVSIGGGQYRCDIRRPESDGCVQRYIRWRETGALPAPRLSAPLPPLPKRVPVAGPGKSGTEEPSEAAAKADETPGPPVPDLRTNETTEPAPVAAGTETPDGGESE